MSHFIAELLPRLITDDGVGGIALKAVVSSDRVPPSNILLSNNEIISGSSVGTRIAVISVIDANEDEEHQISIVLDEDSKFKLDGTTVSKYSKSYLSLSDTVDFDTKDNHIVAIKATDPEGKSLVREFTIMVTPLAPTDITLSGSTVVDGDAIDTPVGEVNAVGGHAPYTFELLPLDDYAKFGLTGSMLTVQGTIDIADVSYDIQLRVTDNEGLQFTKPFTITILSAITTRSLVLNGIDELTWETRSTYLNSVAAFTAAFWIKGVKAEQGYCYIWLANGTDNAVITMSMIYANSTGSIDWVVGYGTPNKKIYVPSAMADDIFDGNWHHVVLAYDSATEDMNGYLDAVNWNTWTDFNTIKNGGAMPATPFTSGGAVTDSATQLGGKYSEKHTYLDKMFTGSVCQYCIWDRVLTLAEITTLSQGGALAPIEGTLLNGLKLSYPFDSIDANSKTYDIVNANELNCPNMDSSNISTDVPV